MKKNAGIKKKKSAGPVKALKKPRRLKTKPACNPLNGKLTRDEQIQVIQWLVEHRSTSQIKQLVSEHFGKDLSRKCIWQYTRTKKWGALIKRLQVRMDRDLSRIPIANKVNRLIKLEKLHDEAMTPSIKGFNKIEKIIYDGKKRTVETVYEPFFEYKIGAAIQAVKEARVEIEGHKIEATGNIQIKVLTFDG